MEHDLITSGDGSTTLQLAHFKETYHSRNGAYTEAQHIYIQNGLEHLFSTVICRTAAASGCLNIFDVGFGTGLNCILAWVWQQQRQLQDLPFPRICYYGIEKYPIQLLEIEQFNYNKVIAQHTGSSPDKLTEIFNQMHSCPWEEDISIGNSSFILHKSCADITGLSPEYYKETKYPDNPALVLYDTFSPATQPELWDGGIFRSIATGCVSGTMLLTYCSKGTVKQSLRNAGFTIERLAGPPGKRHILRGTLQKLIL